MPKEEFQGLSVPRLACFQGCCLGYKSWATDQRQSLPAGDAEMGTSEALRTQVCNSNATLCWRLSRHALLTKSRACDDGGSNDSS